MSVFGRHEEAIEADSNVPAPRAVHGEPVTLGLRLRLAAALLTAALLAVFAPASLFAATFDCLIEPMQMVEIGSPVTGLLDKVLVRRSDRVQKGQVVATLESRAEQAAAELARFKSEALGPTRTAENKIEFSKRKYQRRKEMAAEKLMSAQDRDDAEAEYKLAEAELLVAKESRQLAKIELEQQRSQLNLRTIRSPFDGVVVDQMLYPGEIVEPGGTKKAILRLAQLDPLRVHVILPMAAFGKVNPGAAVTVTPEVPSGSRYAAKVRTIDKLIDAASGTFAVFLEMPNPKLAVSAGVKCKAELDVAVEPLKTDRAPKGASPKK
jgi:RND family efflux transporter MFP subunit